MVDNLPLIPEKSPACTDVRSMLRTVFQELDYLPPLSVDDNKPPEKAEASSVFTDQRLPNVERWADNYESQCLEISNQEDEIKHKHGKRISQEPLPNIFKMPEPRAGQSFSGWQLDKRLLQRKDLRPRIDQNAGGDDSLWVKNILNVSSCDFSREENNLAPVETNAESGASRCTTLQTLSIGQVFPRFPPRPPPVPPPPPSVEYVICVPPEVSFVNCSIGRLYVRHIRLINMSKFEWRLSVTPPKRNEFHVVINSPRGLTITSGANVDLSVQFTPIDVRMVTDTLVVRVSCGQIFTIPIICYMQPPQLDIFIPTAYPRSAPSERVSFMNLNRKDGNEVLELGARLLGDEHCSLVLLQCDAKHVKFFILTEDAWIDWNLNCLTSRCAVISDSFVFWPAWFCGGGIVNACVWCRGETVGTHETALRILCSNAISRELNILADVLYYSPKHLILECHDKNYDICSDEDPGCKYYVNLGTALTHRSLSASIKLINRSPLSYSFFWTSRPWGVCWCWEEEMASKSSLKLDDKSELGEYEAEDERLCPGAQEAKRMMYKDPEAYAKKNEPGPAVTVEPPEYQILAGNACMMKVHVRDVGEKLGVQRSVLRLVLRDIPKQSLPVGLEVVILNTREESTIPIPGLKNCVREVCDVLFAELEVWWDVEPVRFVLEPPVIPLHYSRRINTIQLRIGAWQLYGYNRINVSWVTPARVATPPSLRITTVQCTNSYFLLPLSPLPNDYPETDVFTLMDQNNEWEAECIVTRQSDTRHPSLQPYKAWLGIVTPKTRVETVFALKNDTYQKIRFWCKAFRWCGENPPSAACLGRIPCKNCREVACTCALLRPGRGALAHGETADIFYKVNAPQKDGCVATLLQMRRCEADLSIVHDTAGTEARAVLVAYRVLQPRLIVRFLSCGGPSATCRSDCELDPGAQDSENGTSILRPRKSLVVGRRTCYILRLTNITPISTSVRFQKPLDGTDYLKAKFMPSVFSVRSYGEVEIKIIVSALRVCERRIFVYRADVTHANKPIYVVIDAAIVGVDVSLQVPIGGGITTDEFVIMRTSQRAESVTEKVRILTPDQIFMDEDHRRAFVKANRCHCHITLQYIPPVKRPAPPPKPGEDIPNEIVSEPPKWTRVCRCFPQCKPHIRDSPKYFALEFINVPLRQVRERRLILRNESVVTAHWSTHFRKWPRQRNRTINTDKWADDVCESGIALACSPPSGVLASCAQVEIRVQLYSDCWGLYRDQILVQVDNVDPIVLDVWIEVEGPALEFKIQPKYTSELLPTLWMSPTDSRRTLIAKNISRSELFVTAYVTLDNDHVQDLLPFRLYVRMYDVLPETCPCVDAYDSFSGYKKTYNNLCNSHKSIEYNVDNVDPIVLDVWIEVEGPALEFKIQPKYTSELLPTLWMSPTDSRRTLIAKNISRSELFVTAYVTLDNDHVQDLLPFRLYVRMYDVLPETCPCVDAYDTEFGEQSSTSASRSDIDMDTAIDLYLAPDHGPENDTFYKVTPNTYIMKPGESVKWEVSMDPPSLPENSPNGALTLRVKPLCKAGDGWYRDDPLPQLVQLRQVVVEPWVQLSCKEVIVRICVLDLPYGDFLRIRKRFQVLNVGNAETNISVQTNFPWCIVQGRQSQHTQRKLCDIGCENFPRKELRRALFQMELPPRSSTEVCVEVCISTMEAWPLGAATTGSVCVPPQYEPFRQELTPLYVYDDVQMLFTLPLIVEMEYPEIKTEPQSLDFGFVTDGDTRKTHASISHTCLTKTLMLAVRFIGCEEFKIWPHFLEVAPGASELVYIQYTSTWRHGPAEGCVVVHVCSGAGEPGHDPAAPPSGWCRAALPLRASPTLDHKWHEPAHDHTHDEHLFPQSLKHLLP